MGHEGGDGGGRVVVAGAPEDVAKVKKNHRAAFEGSAGPAPAAEQAASGD
jgi:excinuclease UvrABC ATPase subunit